MTTLTKTQFAAHMGWKSASQVSNLIKAGRIVLTPDGKRVEVEASEARIAATADPSKDGVRLRHALGRGDGISPDIDVDAMSARARGELFSSLNKERDFLVNTGVLINREENAVKLATIGIVVVGMLEQIGSKLAPLLAATNSEFECRELVDDEIGRVRHEIARKLSALDGESRGNADAA